MGDSPRTPSGSFKSFAALWSVLIVAIVLALGAIDSAAKARGQITPGLFVDPFNSYSAVGFPGATTPPLLFPDRLYSVSGVAVPRVSPSLPYPAIATRRRLEAEYHLGVRATVLVFQRGGRWITLSRALMPIDMRVITYFLVIYLLLGALILWSGLVVMRIAESSFAARSYAGWSVCTFAFLASFLDYHSSMRLVPVFSLSTVGIGLGFVWLAFTFPAQPESMRGWKWPLRFISALAVVLGVTLVVGPRLGKDVLAARMIASFFAPVSALVLVVTLVVRTVRGDRDTRLRLRSTVSGMFAAPIFVFAGSMIALMQGSAAVHVLIPLAMPAVPLSIGWALVRNNILGANAVLTRRLLVFPVFLMALGAALAVWLGVRTVTGDGSERLVPEVIAGGVFVALMVFMRRFVQRLLFPATAAFRPTIEQLAETLTDLDHRGDLRATLERTVSRWLPSGRVRLRATDDMAGVDHLPDDALGRLDAGEKVWTLDTPWQRHLLVPMRSLGELRGVLDIAPKHQGALFTEEDLALLDTIAALGAIALHNAEVIAALDAARRIEIEATRDDKRLTLGVLGAELSHEIAHPLQFFRGLVRRGAKRQLDPDDVAIGEEEIERMDRMLSSLRRLEPPARNDVTVTLEEPVARAWVLMREVVRDRELHEHVELPEGCAVVADRDGVVQVFANLLRNAVQAAPRGGHVGVRGRLTDDGALTLDVWDNGPGVPPALVETLFHRWVTSRAGDGGSGLGLSVAQNLVNAFGWQIEYVRDDGRTCFRITVPRDRVVGG